MSFKKFIEQNTVGYHNDGPGGSFNKDHGGSYLSSDQTGSEAVKADGGSPHLPSTDLTIPSSMPIKKVVSVVTGINYNKNPIEIKLQDGTILYLTIDEFRRIGPKSPKKGSKIMVSFQRREDDNSKSPSQIHHIQII